MAATLAIVSVVAVAYIAVRHELYSNIDGELRSEASNSGCIDLSNPVKPTVCSEPSQSLANVQVVSTQGTHANTVGGFTLPIASRDITIATSGGEWMRTEEVQGKPLRVLTVHKQILQTGQPIALQIALPLTAAHNELHKLRIAFLLLALGGLGLVVVGSWVVVRRTLRPVASLTDAAEQIAATRDLTTRIEDYGDDELGRLAVSFNLMLDALERSLGQQRQLILDASHELRTPLASLRTNVEVLHDVDRLSPEQRRSLLDGIVTQLDELTGLVADVVELARGDAPDASQDDIALDDLVDNAVDRARRHWPNVVFMVESQPVTVRGVQGRIDRAVANLLDNAGKFSPSGAVVDVSLTSSGAFTVADRGPGVPEDAVAHVFDRFYRADEARALPGSGLGLAIVKQVVDGHNGTVTLANRAGGGTVVTVGFSPVGEELASTTNSRGEVQPV
jgi:two-component system sensor histidine kinase MprB